MIEPPGKDTKTENYIQIGRQAKVVPANSNTPGPASSKSRSKTTKQQPKTVTTVEIANCAGTRYNALHHLPAWGRYWMG